MMQELLYAIYLGRELLYTIYLDRNLEWKGSSDTLRSMISERSSAMKKRHT